MKVINPYPFLGTKHNEALDFIITNLPANPTFENLNEVLSNALFTPDPQYPITNGFATLAFGSILPNAYNAYVNGGAEDEGRGTKGNIPYTEKQQAIITHLLNGIHHVPVESIREFLTGVEERIVSGGLSYEEQTPLFIATAAGRSDFEYWMNQISNPGTLWAAYFNAEYTVNYLHIASVVSAAMQGALFTYGLVKPPQLQPLDVYTALVGSVGLASGKVVFGWVSV
jgi:hypothetical protein